MVTFVRSVFLVGSLLATYLSFFHQSLTFILIALGISFIVALAVIIGSEYLIHTFRVRSVFFSLLGLGLGLFLAHFFNLGLEKLPFLKDTVFGPVMLNLLYLVFGFGVLMFFLVHQEEIGDILFSGVSPTRAKVDIDENNQKILDTSVIIDGRILDICQTDFIDGILVIPNFVLKELQFIADSADSIKRNRGRRGLDILNKMQKDPNIKVKISDMDFPEIREVDSKLVKLGKELGAKVVTNDYNLNKVAQFQGVKVLNINELSNALKPIVLPGEEMRIMLIKEGKDSNQGVAYLEDGTMVVVENGKDRIGDEVEAVVTSVLQTTAGRMIFTKLKEEIHHS